MVKVIVKRDENNDWFIIRGRISKKISSKCKEEIGKILLPTDRRGMRFNLTFDAKRRELKYKNIVLKCKDLVSFLLKQKPVEDKAPPSLHKIDNKPVFNPSDKTEAQKLRGEYEKANDFGQRTLRGAYAKAGTQETLLRNKLAREGFKGNVLRSGGEFLVRPDGSTYENADRYNISGNPEKVISKALRDEVLLNEEKAEKAEKVAEKAKADADAYLKVVDLATEAGSDIGMIQDIPDIRGGGIRGKIVSDRFFNFTRPVLQSRYDQEKSSIREQKTAIKQKEDVNALKREKILVLKKIKDNALKNIAKSTNNETEKADLENRRFFKDYISEGVADDNVIHKYVNLMNMPLDSDKAKKIEPKDYTDLVNKEYTGNPRQRREAFKMDWEDKEGIGKRGSALISGFSANVGRTKTFIDNKQLSLDRDSGRMKTYTDLIREGYIKDEEYTGDLGRIDPLTGAFIKDLKPSTSPTPKEIEDAVYQAEQDQEEEIDDLLNASYGGAGAGASMNINPLTNPNPISRSISAPDLKPKKIPKNLNLLYRT